MAPSTSLATTALSRPSNPRNDLAHRCAAVRIVSCKGGLNQADAGSRTATGRFASTRTSTSVPGARVPGVLMLDNHRPLATSGPAHERLGPACTLHSCPALMFLVFPVWTPRTHGTCCRINDTTEPVQVGHVWGPTMVQITFSE
jgi:hypothetical protein